MKKALIFTMLGTALFAGNYYYKNGVKVELGATHESRSFEGGLSVDYFLQNGQKIGISKKVVVSFKSGVDVAESASSFGLKFVEKLSDTIVLLEAASPTDAIAASAKLFEAGVVNFAHPDCLSSAESRSFAPADPLYKFSWHLTDTDTIKGANINVQSAWDVTRGRGVKVAVFDDAVLTTHEDMTANVVDAYDPRTDEKSAMPTAAGDTHGTFCAGIAVAASNDKGSLGVAPEASLVALRGATGAGSTDSSTIKAFSYMTSSGVDVMNNSWGSYAVSEGAKAAILDFIKNGRAGKGGVVVFAHGNDSCNDLDGKQCKQNGTGKDMGLLKDDESFIEEALTVGATNQKNQRSSYSNWGTRLDVSAPGGDGDEIAAGGVGMVSTKNVDTTGSDYDSNNPAQVGTSYAAPVVAGVAALVIAANPQLTSAQIMQIIKETADQTGGYAYTNGRSNELGAGKVNAGKAVARALSLKTASANTATSSLVLHQGWNMISSPINGKKIDANYLKSNGAGAMWAFTNGAYAAPTSILIGAGYWANMANDATIALTTSALADDLTVTIDDIMKAMTTSGVWYMAGTPVDTSKTELKSKGAVAVWWYDPTIKNYSTNDAIKAGSGFWVKK